MNVAVSLVLFGAVILLIAFAAPACSFGAPSTQDIVAAFKDNDLPVGDSYPVENLEDWNKSPIPKTYEQGTHFDIPGHGKGHGGPVFAYETQEDLRVMKEYYEQIENMPVFGPSLHSHLYKDGLVLLQINGDVPKTDADLYGDVMRGEV
jgi:hypothetical protein